MTISRTADDYLPDWDSAMGLPAKQDPTQRLRDWVDLFREVVKAAEFLSKTPFVPKEMLGKPADVAAAIMKGHELGMDPLDALANIYVIHGRVGFYAEFQRRRIIQAGHTFRVIESSDTRCIVEGTRREGGEPQRASFSIDQARKAGLDLGKYPADKLIARATSRLCRQVFPDVLSGTLIAEDIIDGLIPTDDQPPTIEDTPPPRAGLQRRRQPPKPKAAATQPPTATTPTPAADDDDLLDENPPQPETGVTTDTIDTLAEHEANKPGAWIVMDADDGTPSAAIPRDSDEGQALIAGYFDSSDDDTQLTLQPEPITPDQLKLLAKRLREAGFTDHASRHGFISAAIGRDYDHPEDLTKDEASRAINVLENGNG